MAADSDGGREALRRDLQAEYGILQGQYEDFDKRALGLKALATPLLGAGLAAGVNYRLTVVVGATLLLALTLWALEATWKAFQYCHGPRLALLEAWFRGDASGQFQGRTFAVPAAPAPFQIQTAWLAAWRADWARRPWRFLKIAVGPFVALPYAAILLAGALAWGAAKPPPAAGAGSIDAPTSSTATR